MKAVSKWAGRPVAPMLLLVVVLLAPGLAGAQNDLSTLEITGASLDTSFERQAAWGWWQPDKYDVWSAAAEDSFDLADLRLLIPGGEYSMFIAAELYPDFSGAGTRYDGQGEVEADHRLTGEIQVYDLALAQSFHYRGGDHVRPWLGLTHMQIGERVHSLLHPELEPDRADSKLWGAVLGVDVELALPYDLVLSSRLMARWATGDRDESFIPETSYGLPDATRVKASDSVNRGMWGAELGLRWQGIQQLGLEAGYRYRDWSYDDGPASFDGPYLRLIFKL